jgi:hypothetical protein
MRLEMSYKTDKSKRNTFCFGGEKTPTGQTALEKRVVLRLIDINFFLSDKHGLKHLGR